MQSEKEIKPTLQWPPSATTSEVEKKAFWKALRHFYRTGEKPADAEEEYYLSVYQRLISPTEAYPFRAGALSLPFGRAFIEQSLVIKLSHFQKDNWARFKKQLQKLISGLSQLVDGVSGIDEQVYGFANDIIAFDKLNALGSQQKGPVLDAARKARLQKVLKSLEEGHDHYARKKALLLVREPNQFDSGVMDDAKRMVLSSDDPFHDTQTLLKTQMDDFTALMKAVRMASLELEGAYQADIHDEHFDHFNWYRLLNDEKRLFHPVFLVIDQQDLIEHLDSFSRLLSTNWPIRILVLNEQVVSEPNPQTTWEDAAHSYRQELSLLAISHRNVYAYQSTLADPQSVFEALGKSLRSMLPAVVHVLLPTGSGEEHLVMAEAAKLGRYFPSLEYDPERPAEEGSHLLLDHNPQTQTLWPTFSLEVASGGKKQELDLTFTYADYKALSAQKREELLVVPPAFADEQLIPVHEYLSLPQDQLYGKVPFIWLEDEADQLQKAAMPNHWVVSCQERADFWSFLKALSGTAGKSEPEQTVPTESESEPVQQASESDIEKAKEEAAEMAVKKIIDQLLKT